MSHSLADLVRHYDRPGPRYTGYPMPPAWRDDFPEAELVAGLQRANASRDPLSFYAHLPFCKRRCAYCGCNVTISPYYDPVEPFLRALHQPERGAARAQAGIEIGGRALPVGIEESVRAVLRDGNRCHADGPEPFLQILQRRHALVVECREAGEIVCQPRPDRRIECQQHDGAARHASHLAQARLLVRPVMDREDCHRGIEALVREWQALGAGFDRPRRARLSLADHLDGGLDGGHVAVRRFV